MFDNDEDREIFFKALELAKNTAYENLDSAKKNNLEDTESEKLLIQLKAYMQGKAGVIPEFLTPYMERAKIVLDPEYIKFDILRDKFTL